MGFRDIRRRFWCPGVHVVRGTCMGVPLAWLSDEVIPMRPHADVPVMFSQSILPAMVIQPTVPQEVFLTSEYICIAMEYATGGSLFHYVQKQGKLKVGRPGP